MAAGDPPGWRLNYPTVAAAIAALAASPDRASWSVTGTRYFACDTAAGNDSNAGYSDVSQAAAGLVAVKTLAKLLSIIPKFGCGRVARAAVKSGNYASDATLDLSGFAGYSQLLIVATDTVASAGAVAFSGTTADGICAGMTTASGMNAAGYNATAYAVAADGTPTITLQVNGGGAPGFGANPNRPYRCRLRFDVATTTVALRNKTASILLVTGGNTLTLGSALGANPVAGDVCYIEMPGVTGPTQTFIQNSGAQTSLQAGLLLVGFSLGAVRIDSGSVQFSGCEMTTLGAVKANITGTATWLDTTFATPNVGSGFFATSISVNGSRVLMTDCTYSNTSVATFNGVSEFLWERSSTGAQFIRYGASLAPGNSILDTVGTNSSTAHGATCQMWGNIAAVAGTPRCGLYLGAGQFVGRIKFSNQGANPCIVLGGAGLGVIIQGVSGGVADGNTDVGVSLQTAAVGATAAIGCNIGVAAGNTATGTVGDVRLSDGTITTWAALAGVITTDTKGNRLIGT